MDNRNTEQLAVPLEKEQESGRYGSVLNVLKISAICFLLDDDLTVLEASNSFYEKTGYSKKEFQTCFQTMRGYYREYPEDWEAIRDRLVYSAENGGADTQTNGIGESLRRRVAQNQYRPGNSGVPQLQRFGHGADAEKGAPIFQQPGDRHGAVAVGVGLDDRHHRHFGLAADRVKIGRNSVQVNDRPGAVVGHNPSGSFRA